MLTWLENGPAYYLAKLNTNEEKNNSMALENGAIVHRYIEDPSTFVVAEVEKVSGKMGTYIEVLAKTGSSELAYQKAKFSISRDTVEESLNEPKNKAYYDYLKLEQSDAIILTKAQTETITRIINAINDNGLFQAILNSPFNSKSDVYNELECYWEYPLYDTSKKNLIANIPVKSKPDKIIINHSAKEIHIIDLKTTSSYTRGELFFKAHVSPTRLAYLDYSGTHWMGKYLYYRYYRQKYFYSKSMLFQEPFAALMKQGYHIKFTFLVVNSSGGYDTSVYMDMDPLKSSWSSSFNYAEHEINSLMHDYYNHIILNKPLEEGVRIIDL